MIHVTHSSCADLARAGGAVRSYGAPCPARCYADSFSFHSRCRMMVAFPKMPNRAEWPVVCHEAAHCVAAISLGWPVLRLAIGDDMSGKCSVDRPPLLVTPELRLALATVRMAGSVAEGLAIQGVGGDFRDVHLHNQKDCDAVTRLAEQAFPGDDRIEERDAFYARAVRRAFDLVEGHRRLILDLATALLERREMVRSEIERVLMISLAKGGISQ